MLSVIIAGIHTCYGQYWNLESRIHGPWPDVNSTALRTYTCQKLKRSTCLPSPASRRAGRPRPLRPPCPRLPGHGWTVQISWTVIECDLITNRVLFHEYIYIYPLLLWIFFSVVCSQKLLWPKMVQVAKVGDCRCVVWVVSRIKMTTN